MRGMPPVSDGGERSGAARGRTQFVRQGRSREDRVHELYR